MKNLTGNWWILEKIEKRGGVFLEGLKSREFV